MAKQKPQPVSADEFDTGRGILSKENPMFRVKGAVNGRTGVHEFKYLVTRGKRQWIHAWSPFGFCDLNVGKPHRVHGIVVPQYELVPCKDVGGRGIAAHLTIKGERYMSKKVKAKKDTSVKASSAIAPKAKTSVKAPKTAAAKKPAKNGSPKMSGLDAAAKVLREAKKPLDAQEITKAAFDKGYWKSSGKTPHATLYAAIIREIAAKGKESRFKKTSAGHFESTGV